MKSLVVALGLVGLLTLAGCGGGDLPDLGYVTGTLTLDGEPVPEVTVMFISTGTDEAGMPVTNTSLAKSDQQGNFKAMYKDGVPGVRAGDIAIQLDITSFDGPGIGTESPPVSPWKAKIPGKFFQVFQRDKIGKGESKVIPLDLKSK